MAFGILCDLSLWRHRDINDHLYFMLKVSKLHEADLGFKWSADKLPPAKEVWGKVMFLHLSVILFTGGVSVQEGLFPGVSVQGVSVQGVSVQGVSIRETPHTVKSGQYASYWNAFLLHIRVLARGYIGLNLLQITNHSSRMELCWPDISTSRGMGRSKWNCLTRYPVMAAKCH